jgi:hypothetical protein
MKPAKLHELPLASVFAMAHNTHHKALWPMLWCEVESRLALDGEGEWRAEVSF